MSLGGSISPSGEVRAVLGRGHTGRSVPVDADYAIARAWSEAGDLAALLAHPSATRFRQELQSVPLLAGPATRFVRGRRDDGRIRSWRDMGPPKNAPSGGRYNLPGEVVLYLCDSQSGVLRELEPLNGAVLFLQDYELDPLIVRIADFAGPQLSEFLKAVFDIAECSNVPGRPGLPDYTFSEVVACLVRQHGFDGMVVPGVRGVPNDQYCNVVVFNPQDWQRWSCRKRAFRSS
jgi:hypothetical protein